MKSKNLAILLIALVAVVAFTFQVSAADNFAHILRVGVNGFNSNEQVVTGQIGSIGVFAGENVPVRVYFTGLATEPDARVSIRLTGGSGYSAVTDRFDIVNGSSYSIPLTLKVPSDIDPDEPLFLEVVVESRNGGVGDRVTIELEAQRDSYNIEILSAESGADQVKAGQTLLLDVVLKNRGRQTAEDNYVKASIAELGVSNTVYFGDLTAEDQADPDKDDTVERNLYLAIPKNAAPGVYTITLEAYNSDASTTRTRRVVVTGAGGESRVLSSSATKTFAVGEQGMFTVTLVNAGNEIKVYELSVDAPEGLSVELEDNYVVVPAGSSKSVKATVVGTSEGSYNFAVNVQSDGELIKKESFTAKLEGKSATKVNPSVVLTVVLAVIFIVLVVVLIVLLTRRPQKTEEFGESYY